MKIALVLCIIALAAARPEEGYSTRYDNFNAQELVDNIRLLKSYGNCFLDKGPCTAEGSDFKKLIPDALKTNCAKCSTKQRNLIRVVTKGFQNKLPEMWKELAAKEDPNNEYHDAFNKFLNESDTPKMKLFILLSVLAAVAFARPDGDHYDSKYDKFDVKTLTENPRLMKAGPTEAVATTCGKCTPKQRQIVRTVIRALQEQLPNEWDQLVKLHDPEGKYKESFGKFLASTD
ncbi:allergen Tha p 1-like [Leguminivora glycinivorella]|uniref:allergen Tha p 1-like n=1 Tax=Leguminivora glycinivorella TaxID=1035111 RepID=UPI00200BC14E|nr:allergen Tha p 1-like [Leguminivora glycinivorella]